MLRGDIITGWWYWFLNSGLLHDGYTVSNSHWLNIARREKTFQIFNAFSKSFNEVVMIFGERYGIYNIHTFKKFTLYYVLFKLFLIILLTFVTLKLKIDCDLNLIIYIMYIVCVYSYSIIRFIQTTLNIRFGSLHHILMIRFHTVASLTLKVMNWWRRCLR